MNTISMLHHAATCSIHSETTRQQHHSTHLIFARILCIFAILFSLHEYGIPRNTHWCVLMLRFIFYFVLCRLHNIQMEWTKSKVRKTHSSWKRPDVYYIFTRWRRKRCIICCSNRNCNKIKWRTANNVNLKYDHNSSLLLWIVQFCNLFVSYITIKKCFWFKSLLCITHSSDWITKENWW